EGGVTMEHRFHTPDRVELDVNVPFGEIDVQTVDGEETTVWVDGDEAIVEATEVRQDGRRIVVQLRGKKVFGFTISIGDFSFTNRRLSIRVAVPHGSRAELTTASADMKVRGRVEALEVKSASGDLAVVGEVERDVVVKSVSGDTHVAHARQGNVNVQSVSGDIEIGVPQGTNLDVDAGSVSGDLTSEVPLGSERTGDDDGPTLIVRGKTVSGDFRVFRAA